MDDHKGQRVGYTRVSTAEQKIDRQLHKNILNGQDLERVFTDIGYSGKDKQRPGLQDCLKYLREGDTLVCHSFDRLSRSLVDLNLLITELTCRGVKVHFVKESLTFTGESNSFAELQLNIMGAVAQFERTNMLERQKEGIERAKENGVYANRKTRGPKITATEQKRIVELIVNEGYNATEVAFRYSISRQTVYSYLTKAGIKREAKYQQTQTKDVPPKYARLE